MSNSDVITTRLYLSAPSGHFWRWSEDGEAVEWSSGETIVFRAELRAVVDRLMPRGLPPLDELLMLLGACRSHWRTREEFYRAVEPFLEGSQDRRAEQTDLLYHRLRLIHDLPADVRESLDAKLVLVDTVFDHSTFSPSVVPGTAMQVRTLLETNAASPRIGIRPAVATLDREQETRRCLAHLVKVLDRVTPEILRLRHRTGLDQLPETAEIEVPDEPSLREFLRSLQEDSDLGGMARLARQLMAVVDLPRKIAEPDDLPMGGVSDIANRGSLDRLLLSELAHDDLTLAVRVAVNEALYLRRESPPKSPPEQRAILVDAGLRLWGVPRVFAAAVALALAANSEQRAEVEAWRAAGTGLAPLSLGTRDGLMDLLETLDHSLHPGDALPAFRDAVARDSGDGEALLITSAETLADPEFQRALADDGPTPVYVATVDRAGEFRLWLRSAQGRKLVREATLDLDQILTLPAPKKRPVPLIDKDRATRMPAFLSVRPMPLRLPHQFVDDNTWKFGPDSFLSLTKDGRLMLWDDRKRGAREIVDGLPRGKVAWGDAATEGTAVRFLILDRPERKMFYVTMGPEGSRLQVTPIWFITPASMQAPIPDTFYRHGDGLFCLSEGPGGNAYFRVVHAETGETLHNGSLPLHLKSVGGRFFLTSSISGTEQRIVAPTWNGSQIDVHPLAMSQNLRNGEWLRELVCIFERVGVDGPLAVLRSGKVLQLIDGASSELSFGLATPVGVSDILPDGSRLLVRAGGATQPGARVGPNEGWFFIDYPAGTRTPAYSSTQKLQFEGFWRFDRFRTTYKRFFGIYSDGSNLILTRRDGGRWKLLLDQDVPKLVRTGQESQSPSNWAGFMRITPTGSKHRLRMASLRDGSRVFLDSRGLLHLQSSDPSIPEMTLVLSELGVAGWIAGAGSWGHPYFLNETPEFTPAEVFESFLRPFAARCV